ncbi:hypothetical protein [Pseudohalocynthiibacter sp. F2068]|jgi:RTX calcium-binding nonapeptide repeat (4 copies)|uniref:hypothetical protein n=1 Tax=Pseudohalocynthiibacter sp. F2068 TaxID=2926418 RepID=UPI001FF2630A|nr:hypothetical protein [Pseudohalocynthiibacter sp. F2068]MCK0104449.1 hypothetical protein [Pseudohalocynthiibacter sp. F2068]
MAITNIHGLSEQQYLAMRNALIKPLENTPLFNGDGGDIVYMDDENNPTSNAAIGYGWDLRVNTAVTTINNLNAVGIFLSAEQIDDLNNYTGQNPTVTSAQLLASWSNVTITEMQATNLLNIASVVRETAISNHFGSHDIPFSEERAAIFSHVYNIGVGGIGATTRLVRSNPNSLLEEFGSDTISAGAGNDTIVYASGNDVIVGNSTKNTGFDTLDLSQYAANEVSFAVSVHDVLITTPDGVIELDYQVRNALGDVNSNIERVIFSDGSLDEAGITARALDDQSTSGDDIISGTL